MALAVTGPLAVRQGGALAKKPAPGVGWAARRDLECNFEDQDAPLSLRRGHGMVNRMVAPARGPRGTTGSRPARATDSDAGAASVPFR